MSLPGLNGLVIGLLVAALFMASWNLFGAKKQVRLPVWGRGSRAP
ncbi:hypothetical protein PSEUDO8O_170086 [Pseudomonas sp. 8O]|nr:hypothetical protein PSEUDO8O_170086 [Pseudomonas sp. 8O]